MKLFNYRYFVYLYISNFIIPLLIISVFVFIPGIVIFVVMERKYSNTDNWIELNRDETIIGFINMCVIALSHLLKIPFREALNKLENKGLISNYIIPQYDMLHIESMNNIVQKINKKLNGE